MLLRPNFAMDAPPESITIGGADYPCETDFRTWIEITLLFREIIQDADTPQHINHNVEIMEKMQEKAFGGILVDEDPGEVMRAMAEFSRGYPCAPVESADENGPDVFSFKWDLNYIIIAIRNQSGIDLSYRRKEKFHWWEFLLEFNTLCGDHYILNLMEARGYSGKDKEMIRRKRRCALPVEYTAAEQAEIDAFNAMFEGRKSE